MEAIRITKEVGRVRKLKTGDLLVVHAVLQWLDIRTLYKGSRIVGCCANGVTTSSKLGQLECVSSISCQKDKRIEEGKGQWESVDLGVCMGEQ